MLTPGGSALHVITLINQSVFFELHSVTNGVNFLGTSRQFAGILSG